MGVVKSVEELKKLHLKDVKKKVDEQRKKLDERLDLLPEAKHEDYHSIVQKKLDDDGLSYSSMKRFRESPISFIEYLIGERKEKTPALIRGTIVDEAITNRDNFHKRIFVMPEKVSRKSNEGKAIYELYQDLAGGALVIDQEQFEEAMTISEAVWKNDHAKFYLSKTVKFQVPLRFKHRETKYRVRGFIDMEGPEEDPDVEFFIGDLKTGTETHANDWPRAIAKWWYHGQIGTYTMGYKYKWKFPAFIHLAVETSAPYNVNIFRADSELLRVGQEEVQNTLLAFKRCHDNNLWHQSYEFIRDEGLSYTSMDLPGYYKPRLL